MNKKDKAIKKLFQANNHLINLTNLIQYQLTVSSKDFINNEIYNAGLLIKELKKQKGVEHIEYCILNENYFDFLQQKLDLIKPQLNNEIESEHFALFEENNRFIGNYFKQKQNGLLNTNLTLWSYSKLNNENNFQFEKNDINKQHNTYLNVDVNLFMLKVIYQQQLFYVLFKNNFSLKEQEAFEVKEQDFRELLNTRKPSDFQSLVPLNPLSLSSSIKPSKLEETKTEFNKAFNKSFIDNYFCNNPTLIPNIQITEILPISFISLKERTLSKITKINLNNIEQSFKTFNLLHSFLFEDNSNSELNLTSNSNLSLCFPKLISFSENSNIDFENNIVKQNLSVMTNRYGLYKIDQPFLFLQQLNQLFFNNKQKEHFVYLKQHSNRKYEIVLMKLDFEKQLKELKKYISDNKEMEICWDIPTIENNIKNLADFYNSTLFFMKGKLKTDTIVNSLQNGILKTISQEESVKKNEKECELIVNDFMDFYQNKQVENIVDMTKIKKYFLTPNDFKDMLKRYFLLSEDLAESFHLNVNKNYNDHIYQLIVFYYKLYWNLVFSKK